MGSTILAQASVNWHLATLKKAFNLAVREWEWCQRNPVLSVSMKREHNGRDRWLTVEEEGRVLAACGPWLHDIVQLPWEPACGWERFCRFHGREWISPVEL